MCGQQTPTFSAGECAATVQPDSAPEFSAEVRIRNDVTFLGNVEESAIKSSLSSARRGSL